MIYWKYLLIFLTGFLLMIGDVKLESEIVCESSTFKIDCGDKFVEIVSANYGRTSLTECPHQSIKTNTCYAASSFDVVSNICNNKTSCSFQVTAAVFGGDPCHGTYKYLEAEYTCQAICGDPPEIENAVVVSYNTPQYFYAYLCVNDTIPSGDPRLTCLETGEWQEREFACVDKDDHFKMLFFITFTALTFLSAFG